MQYNDNYTCGNKTVIQYIAKRKNDQQYSNIIKSEHK